MVQAAQGCPSRLRQPARWLYLTEDGVQVWEIDGHPQEIAGVLIGQGAPVIMLNRQIVGTDIELAAIGWARLTIGDRPAGYHTLCR